MNVCTRLSLTENSPFPLRRTLMGCRRTRSQAQHDGDRSHGVKYQVLTMQGVSPGLDKNLVLCIGPSYLVSTMYPSMFWEYMRSSYPDTPLSEFRGVVPYVRDSLLIELSKSFCWLSRSGFTGFHEFHFISPHYTVIREE